MSAPRRGVPLSEWSTMGVGGRAQWFVRASTEQEVLAALAFADAQSLPVFILGGGSNVVVADDGIAGVVIHVSIEGIEAHTSGDTVLYQVGAGEPWDPFVARTVDDHTGGIECLSGIPGLVGGTPVQNVGAYGQEVAATIRTVRVIDRCERTTIDMTNADAAFGYRTSRFKHADANRFIVVRVDFALTRGVAPTVTYADVVKHFEGAAQPATLRNVREAIIAIRSRKGMVIRAGNPANRSCGSFFVNPVVPRSQLAALGEAPHYPTDQDHVKIPAAWLIERAGYPRGHVSGRVGISPFQAQGLINRGGASAADVVGLALAIKRAVLKVFGIALVPEPVFVGFSSDPAVDWLLDPTVDS